MNDGLKKYQRSYLILGQEDIGYGSTQEPSGYVKIEVKDGRGKLQFSVQNLREGQNQISYKAYMLQGSDNTLLPVYVGEIPVKGGRGEMCWEFDPVSVGGTGVAVEKFNIAAVAAEAAEGGNLRIACPLAACRDKTVDWKERFKMSLKLPPAQGTESKKSTPDVRETQVITPEDAGEILQKEDIYSKFTGEIESIYVSQEQGEAGQGESEPLPQLGEDENQEKDQEQVEVKDEAEDEDEDQEKAEVKVKEKEEVSGEEKEREFADIPTIPVQEPENKEQGETSAGIGKDPLGFDVYKEMLDKDLPGNSNPLGKGAPYSYGCIYNNTACYLQQEGDYNKCATCSMNSQRKEPTKAEKKQGDLERFKTNLGRYFEACNPFGSRKTNYKWWKVSSPVFLNNLLYQCDIKTPLLFNPTVIMAHYKYRHLIVGIFSDRVRRREYIVCGIPGVYGIDEKPFGDMCMWVQLEGYQPKYGAFGYWLVYIDSRSGKLLRVN